MTGEQLYSHTDQWGARLHIDRYNGDDGGITVEVTTPVATPPSLRSVLLPGSDAAALLGVLAKALGYGLVVIQDEAGGSP